MSRLEVVETWLRGWAARKHRLTSPVPLRPGSPASDDDATDREIDGVVASLPAPLRVAVEECYLQPGEPFEHAARLGCPVWTLNRRLSRAHRLVLGTVLDRRTTARDAHHVATMKSRLAED